MSPNQTKNLVNFITFFSLLAASNFLLAQQKFEYNGTLQIDKYTGDAKYEYKIVDKDTLIDGPFYLKRSSLQALLDKEDVSFLFQGDFTDGSPSGPWKFQFGEFKSNSQSTVVDYEYRVLVSGVQEEGSGDMKNGKPNGKWIYEVNQIKESEKVKALFKSEIDFENGIPQRNFEIENEDAILVGRFLRNGLAHDEWTSYDTEEIEDTESWFFEEGLLRKIQSIEEGVSKEILVFDEKSNAYETINLDERYIEILKIELALRADSKEFGKNLPKLLADNAAYYQKINGILSKLGTSDFKPKFKVLVPYFVIDSLENENTKAIKRNYLAAESLSSSLLNDSQLNILKRSDNEVLYYYNSVLKIQETFLNPLKKFVSLSEQNILPFVDRKKFTESLWSNTKPSTKIEVVSDSTGTKKIFELPNSNAFSFETNDINSLQQLSEYAKLSLENIQSKLANQVSNDKRAQTLIDLEERLITKNEFLMQQMDSVNQELPVEHLKALSNIKKLADESLSKYASLEIPEEKLNYGETLEKCLSELINLSNTIVELPAQAIEIDSLYQDSVFNPFMAVVMDEEIKKRITSAYDKVLIPYFLGAANKSLTCENAVILHSNMKLLHQRMLALRDEDTKKLERKLRREKDPKTLYQLLSVPFKKAEK